MYIVYQLFTSQGEINQSHEMLDFNAMMVNGFTYEFVKSFYISTISRDSFPRVIALPCLPDNTHVMDLFISILTDIKAEHPELMESTVMNLAEPFYFENANSYIHAISLFDNVNAIEDLYGILAILQDEDDLTIKMYLDNYEYQTITDRTAEKILCNSQFYSRVSFILILATTIFREEAFELFLEYHENNPVAAEIIDLLDAM